MTPVPIRNTVLLSVDKKLIDEITTESGFKLYLSPEYNFEENASVEGTVVSLPKNYIGNLAIGDNVVFSYHTISDREFPNTSELFIPISEPSSDLRIWQNGKGEKLRMRAHQGAIAVFWVGVYFDAQGRFDPEKSTRGTEDQVERWMHQNFKFGNCENFIHKNLLSLDNKEYWKCGFENIFAKKVGDEVVAVGDRVVCKFIDIPIERRLTQIKGIQLPDTKVAMRLYDRAVVLSGGEDIGLGKGDIVSFNEGYAEKYKMFGQEYCLIKKNRIEGIWMPDKKTA